ncbi:transmembrane protein 141 [Sipha flava]|uniref:Transmembrane protein 141 n=1 Tax=Sipha flava TaxID=143950 RepID=A0A8B8GB49_9HEMI|nr:transmembrane protein 141 [Sipha flava]
MNRTSEKILKEHFEEQRPGFSSYLDCLTRSYGTGVGVFAATFAVVHVAQQIAAKRFPQVKSTHIAVSTVAGTVASYFTAKNKVRECRDLWANWQERERGRLP